MRSLPFLLAVAALALYSIAGFVAAPWYLEREIPRLVERKLGAKAEVAAIRINPLLFRFEMVGFRLSGHDGEPLLALDRLFVDVGISSLLRWAWTIDEVVLERPGVSLRIDPKGKLNVASLYARLLAADDAKPAPAPAPRDAKLPRVLLRRLALDNGRVSLFDQTLPGQSRANFDDISLDVRDVSTLAGEEGDYAFSAKMPGGGTVDWRGQLSLSPIASDGEITVKGVRLSRLLPFLRLSLNIEEPKGTVDLGLRYKLAYAGGNTSVSADNMSLGLNGVELKLAGAAAPIVQVDEAKLQGGSFDLEKRQVAFAELALRRGRVAATLDESGTADWQRLVVGPPAAPVVEPTPAARGGAEESWRLSLAAFKVEELAVRVTDESRVQPLVAEIGRVNIGFSAAAQTGRKLAATVDRLAVNLSNISLGARGAEPQFTVEQARLDGGRVDLGKRAATIGSLQLSGGALRLAREADGSIALQQIFASKSPQAGQPRAEGAAPFSVSLQKTGIDRFAINVADRSTEPAVRYDIPDLKVQVEGFSTTGKKPLRYEVSATVAQGGELRAAGEFDLARLRADSKFALTRFALAPLEPMLQKYATLKLASGSVSVGGNVTWNGKTEGLDLTYIGRASLDDLLLNDPDGKRFFTWQALNVNGIVVDTAEARVAVGGVRLVAPAGDVIIDKARKLNLAAALRTPAKPAAPVAPAAPAQPAATKPYVVGVDVVRLEKGEFQFTDQGLVLPFSAHIHELNGAITGVSSDPKSRATTNLEGRVDEFGLARISGSINGFAPKVHTDLNVEFRNVSLPPLSAYSATFAGRLITSGRLSLDLNYKVENSELRGENKVVLEQFVLGDRVESSSAADLPLDLAIALLTDSEGKITADLPVRGNVDHPDFEYGSLMMQALRTMLVGIVSAPFRALGAMFSGTSGALPPEELGFDAGSARLLPPEREKLAQIAKSVQQRPQLRLVVQGTYNTDTDGLALRETLLRRSLAERLGFKPPPGNVVAPVPFGNVRVQLAIEAQLAERAGSDGASKFAADFEAKAKRSAARANPTLAATGRGNGDRELYEAMFQRLVELEPLPKEALPALANQRADVVMKELTGAVGMPAARTGQKGPEAVPGNIGARFSVDAVKTP